MKQLRYYYDAVLKSDEDCYIVEYYCSDGKTRLLAGKIYGQSYVNVLTDVKKIVNALNQPKPLFGRNGRIAEWIEWKMKIRNQKKYEVI